MCSWPEASLGTIGLPRCRESGYLGTYCGSAQVLNAQLKDNEISRLEDPVTLVIQAGSQCA